MAEDVRVGDVWEDCDPRNAGRKLRVVAIDAAARQAVCTDAFYERTRRYRIQLARMRPRANGYRLVSRPHEDSDK